MRMKWNTTFAMFSIDGSPVPKGRFDNSPHIYVWVQTANGYSPVGTIEMTRVIIRPFGTANSF